MIGSAPSGRLQPDPSSQEPARDFDPEEGRAILRALFAQYRVKLMEFLQASVAQTDDLFESHSHIPDGDVEAFKNKRPEWLEKFDKTLCDLFERRVVEGVRRKGRRPDQETSLATLRVLTSFDHDRQEALKDATRFLDRFTKREIAALDLRIELLLGDPGPRDIDNPFSVSYILDAVGSSARTVYPNPRVWRPFMERVLADLTSEINKLYISLNRFLADRGVLPEIKAALRARSEFRPYDDRDLLPTFSKMLHEALPEVPHDVVVPESLADPNAPPSLVFADSFASKPAIHRVGIDPNEMSAAKILAGLAALAAVPAGAAGAGPDAASAPASADATGGFPSLDPLMALGTSTPLFATLAHWQRLDLPTAIAAAAPKPASGSSEGMVVPLNLIPHIRAAIEDQISNDTDRITMDVIALLFDYIFRDKSIPDSLRALFGQAAGADRQGSAARPDVLLRQEASGPAASRPPRRGGRRRDHERRVPATRSRSSRPTSSTTSAATSRSTSACSGPPTCSARRVHRGETTARRGRHVRRRRRSARTPSKAKPTARRCAPSCATGSRASTCRSRCAASSRRRGPTTWRSCATSRATTATRGRRRSRRSTTCCGASPPRSARRRRRASRR